MRNLPEELLAAIVYYLPPADTLSFSATCRQCNKITYEQLVWQRHCLETWRYWNPNHELKEKLLAPPAQVKWRQLYNQRSLIPRSRCAVRSIAPHPAVPPAAHGEDLENGIRHQGPHAAPVQ